jgi:DNA replication protein DnaC
MDTLDFSRSRALNNVPKKKLLDALASVENSADDLQTKSIKLTAINRYAESNIPIEYWTLKMERDFVGDPRLLAKYNEYVLDMKASYIAGTSFCLAGPHGVGKTLTATCILKKAAQKGYSCLYSDMSNIVSVLTQGSGEDKFISKRELSLVDFLVIDEIDPRFFKSSEASNELFARNLENIFRTRRQNTLPTILCTNSPNIIESFIGDLKNSLSSLFSDKVENFIIFSSDYRKQK